MALAPAALQDGCPAQLKAVTLTKDHLAIHPAERARIVKGGGYVSREGRLSGRIQVSRAFGDAPFKKVALLYLLEPAC
jgi:serine/threonine protein phosphatase PrpC